MTATDELRAMLDERVVPYVSAFTTEGHPHTSWRDEDYREVSAVDFGERKLLFHGNIIPAQAVAATLGAGTCTLINAADDLGSGTSSCMCFECGYTALDDWWEEFNFCPNCGRRIEVTE